jgi:hypothetical protein
MKKVLAMCGVLLMVACGGRDRVRPADAQDSSLDSVSRAVKKMMNTYLTTLDSSMERDPFGFDSVKFPDIDYSLRDSAKSH